MDPKQFVELQLAQGKNITDITQSLTASGWTTDQVNGVLTSLSAAPPPPPSSLSSDTQRPTASANALKLSFFDGLMHILSYISLYVVVTTILISINILVNIFLPPLGLTNGYSATASYYAASKATMYTYLISSIIVTLPLFVGFFIYTNKLTTQNPALLDSKARKFFSSTILVFIFIYVLILFIQIITSMLEGNITQNYLAKVIPALILVLPIFAYYGGELKKHVQFSTKIRLAFLFLILVYAFSCMLLLFTQVDAPLVRAGKTRDKLRVSAVQSLSYAIRDYYRINHAFPATLESIAANSVPYGTQNANVNLDPLTNKPYEYHVSDSANYTICVNFEQDEVETARSSLVQQMKQGTTVDFKKGNVCVPFEVKN
ncbi:MAG: hypothetical protein WCO78_03880 [Candidatus Roizmanbacteria bacterium]